MFLARPRAAKLIPRRLLFSSVKLYFREDVVHFHSNARRLTSGAMPIGEMKRKADEDLVRNDAKTAQPSLRAAMKYPNGAIRITRTPGRKDAKNCVNLPDIIDKDHLVSACIFAYFIADPELVHYLPVSRSSDTVPVSLARSAQRSDQDFMEGSPRQIYIGRDADPAMDPTLKAACKLADVGVTEKLTTSELEVVARIATLQYQQMYGENLHPFYVQSLGSAHSKIMALVYPGFLRIVITSCDMIDADFKLADNHWYIHDLPKLPFRGSVSTPSFESDFLEHLQALSVPEKFLDSIRGMYDYSKVRVHLVTSVPMVHSGASAEKYGLLRLRRVLMDLGLDLPQKLRDVKLRFEVCTGNIGNVTIPWLKDFYKCAIGQENIRIIKQSAEEIKKSPEVPSLKVFFPTFAAVRAADVEAQRNAINIKCHIQPWKNAPVAIKRLFHNYRSKDVGRLLHQKFILTYDPHDNDALPYYVYIGSANLSLAAWGSLSPYNKENKATCDLKLTNITNFECGVVVPGDVLEGLLEPDTSSWREAVVTYDQTVKAYHVFDDKPWNNPGRYRFRKTWFEFGTVVTDELEVLFKNTKKPS